MTKYQHEIQKYLKNTRFKVLTSASDPAQYPSTGCVKPFNFFFLPLRGTKY